MNYFEYKGDELFCEDISLEQLAEKEGTPLYVYSKKTLLQHYHAFDDAFSDIEHIVCYSVKACSNINILKLFCNEGSGTDIVSGGELFRSLKAGVDSKKIVYSGVGKSAAEIIFALKSDILIFNTESVQEIERINELAGSIGTKGSIGIRINPNVDPKTHPYISTGLKENKFGISIDEAFDVYLAADKMENIDVIGVSCHIGSQLLDVTPFVDALAKVTDLIKKLHREGIAIKYLDIGGGLGIPYNDGEKATDPRIYGEKVINAIRDIGCTLILEPGRVIAGNSGILLTKVLYTKVNEGKNFVIADAAMNDLLRPSLYGSYHGIESVHKKDTPMINGDIVGPICESGDFIAKDREMPDFEQDDLICVRSAGAYGFTMASNYNSRPRAAEVLVDGDKYTVINKRETYDDLIKGETK